MTSHNERFTLSREEFDNLFRREPNTTIDLNNLEIDLVFNDDDESFTLSPEEFDNLFTITKVHNLRIRIVLSDSGLPSSGLQELVNHLASNVRRQFSPELVESNEILMISPEDRDKQRLMDKEYLEKTVQGVADIFAKSKLWCIDLLYNLAAHLELIINHPTGTQVVNYVISKDKVLTKNTTLVPSATLDTNVVIQYWEQHGKAEIVESLLELAQNGQLDLRVSGRIREDMKRPDASDRINRLPELGIREIGSIIRTGCWRPGRDTVGSTKFQEVVNSIPNAPNRPRKKRPDWRDWDHLQAHYLSERDVFLTWDKGILNAARHFKEKLGIVIMDPEEYLQSCKGQIPSKSSG